MDLDDNVNLISYTSLSNMYKFQSDGYVTISGSNIDGRIAASIYGCEDTENFIDVSATKNNTISLFVRAGMRIYIRAKATGHEAFFVPLH